MSENSEGKPFEFLKDMDSSAELPHYYEILDSQREISIGEMRKILADHHTWIEQTRGNAVLGNGFDEYFDTWLLQSKTPKQADLSNLFFPKRARKNGIVLASDFGFPNDLYKVNFSGANLADQYFGHANLDGSNLQRSIIPLAFFDTTSMIGCDLRNCYAKDAYFISANLSRANFQNAFLEGAKFYEFEDFNEKAIANGGFLMADCCPFIGAYRVPAIVRDANFSGATGLNEKQLFWFYLNGAILDDAQKEIAENYQMQASQRGYEEIKREKMQVPRRPQGSSPAPQ